MQKYLKIAFFTFASAILVACSNSVDPSDSDSGDIGKISEPTEETSSSDTLETFTDSRDGQTYKMVKIGEQTWMAENLNYQTETSFCYNDDTTQCSVFGHYYSRAEALNACPDGWHLPSNEEWDTLIAEVGGPDSANAKLRSTSMWALSSGTDEFSFKVLPSGSCQTNSNGTKGCSSFNDNFHYYATIWSSDVFLIDEHALFTTEYYYYLEIGGSNTRLEKDFYKSYHRNIRCIKGSKTSSSSATISNFPIVEPCKTESEDHCEYGTLTDKRDGQTYKTVKIGEQWWMAENLDYAYLQPTADLDSSSFYYHDNVLLGHKYDPETESYLEFPLKPVGRLYLWSAAMDSAGLWSTGSKGCGEGSRCTATFPVQGVCPEGWHLPTRAEFDTLIAAVGGENIAGKALKSSITKSSSESFFGEEGVTIWGNSKGSDAYGFAACPSGQRCPYNYCGGEGSIYGSIDGEFINASFWTSSELDSTHASFMLLRDHDATSLVTYRKGNALSIRCIKD